jgi:peptidoglycan/xylan/chitin deacetylase (PgdA/CDA1 family)
MFFDQDIKANRLPSGVLCLTYDDGPGESVGDGPGPHTLELGRYLHTRGIAATFFVVGRHAEGKADLLGQLRAWGHLVGNHTYSHPGLVSLALAGGDVVGEIDRTHAIIRNGHSENVVFLRPPYGNWREKKVPDSPDDKSTSVVAEILNRSGQFPDYLGPINWDISAADYDYWRRRASAEEAAQGYLEKVDHIGRGIVLMHDSSEEAAVRALNQTLAMTKRLVPILQANGYRFIRLDEIPQVQSAMKVCCQIMLETEEGRHWAWRIGGNDGLTLDTFADSAGGVFGIVRLKGNRIALRAANG